MTETIKHADGTLMQASYQWRTRPADERFATLEDAHAAALMFRAEAKTTPEILVKSLTVEASGDNVAVVGKTGASAVPTFGAFGQLAARLGAPAGYLRDLPATLAAECLRHGIADADEDQTARLLLRQPAGSTTMGLHALTGGRYVRVWNHEVTSWLLSRVSGTGFRAPEPFRTATHVNGTFDPLPAAYLSDHDVFVFMVDYERTIEVGGSQLLRGFFLRNSETGDASLSLTTFLLDYVCCNSIVWGSRDATEIRIRHTGDRARRALTSWGEVDRAVKAFGEGSDVDTVATIRSAQGRMLGQGKDQVVAAARKRTDLSLSVLRDAYDVAVATPRYGDPASAWAMVNGLTEVSQRGEHADQRFTIDRAASRLIDF